MLRTRIIPTLLLSEDGLVKTTRFAKPSYIGDPVNTVRIFNELEVDELIFLDIKATRSQGLPNYKILSEIANECFMPLGYGGGIRTMEQVQTIFKIGFEKIILNSIVHESPSFLTQVTDLYGNQAVVASMDVKKNIWGKYEVWSHGGTKNTKKDALAWSRELERLGAGEILLTSMDREGTWSGFDQTLIKKVSDAISVPLIAHGGGGSVNHIGEAVLDGNASAVALGSMVVYQQKGMGVLINFPEREKLESILP